MKMRKPNFLVLWGGDIGYWNISYNHRGMMGYATSHIDRLGHEGVTFTDYYGQQSRTAGCAAFITGQNPVRTGLTKVGMPGAALGLQPEDPTIAELLEPLGYRTAQFGDNHLGDRDEFLPTEHGFDEFYGNLPQRGVIHSFSDGCIDDTGPLTRARMETIDDDVTARACAFIERAHAEREPFFVWWSATMVEHDERVGRLLDTLDELGVADETLVLYSTDSGPRDNRWPDGGITPFRSEKNATWEGAFRVPAFVRWPRHIRAGSVLNGIFSHEDWLPTMLAAAGVPDIKERLLHGHDAGEKHFKVHIDGYNMVPYLTGQSATSPREEFFYVGEDAQLVAVRHRDWKILFAEQRAETIVPRIFDLRRDPFERADENSNRDWDWVLDHAFILAPVQAYVGALMASLEAFPPRQKRAAFNLDRVMDELTMGGVSSH